MDVRATGTLAERDPYLTVEAVEALTGLDRATIFRRIDEGEFAVKPSDDVSGNGRRKTLIRLGNLPSDAQLKYWQQQLTPAASTDPAATINLAEAPAKSREEALRRLAIVQEAIAIKASRERITIRTAMLAAQYNASRPDGERTISARSIDRWVTDYQRDGLSGLVPDWGQNKGRFTAISEALQGVIKDTYLQPTMPSVTDVHDEIDAFCAAAHLPCPSVTTINRFIRTIPRAAVLASRYGQQAYRAHGEPKIHRDYLDLAVGEVWVGDHRELDLFVRASDEPGAKIFRPWLTAWMDLRSRTIVGWHLDLVPNSHTIALALRAGILQYGLPMRLYMDNGKDYTANFWGGKATYSKAVALNEDSRTVLALLNVTVTHAQVRAPWSKAIEPWFGHTLPSWERTLNGWCGRDNRTRPEKLVDEIKTGRLLTLAQCREQLAARIAQYHDREHSELHATPRSIWAGVEKRIPDARALDLILMKHKPARVYQQGIKLFNRHYWHDALIPMIGQTVEIRYDAANIGALVCFTKASPNATPTFLCEAREDKAFSMNLTEGEAKEIGRRRKAARQVVAEYRETQAVAWDPDVAMQKVVNDRRSTKVVTLYRPDPTPEPSGPVMPQVTGFERAAESRARSAQARAASELGNRQLRRATARSASPAPATPDADDLDRETTMKALLGE